MTRDEMIKRLEAVLADFSAGLAVSSTPARRDTIEAALDALRESSPSATETTAEPVAWLIDYTYPNGRKMQAIHRHNSIGDYRHIDQEATPTPLYAAPVSPRPEERDTALLDWAEKNPEDAMREIQSWWDMAGPGCREVKFNFRGVMKGAMERSLRMNSGPHK